MFWCSTLPVCVCVCVCVQGAAGIYQWSVYRWWSRDKAAVGGGASETADRQMSVISVTTLGQLLPTKLTQAILLYHSQRNTRVLNENFPGETRVQWQISLGALVVRFVALPISQVSNWGGQSTPPKDLGPTSNTWICSWGQTAWSATPNQTES